MFLVKMMISVCLVKALDALDDGMHDYSRNKEAYKRPHYGDRSNPAKSCAAIFKQLPNLPSGVYWLDVYDSEKKKTIQEKHYCQNTVSNETKTGLKYKGQQKEIGIEDLSLGPPDPEPFDWEELTAENWPLPITPPSKEEMKQRLQKALKDYKEKMKDKNKGNSGSNFIWNSIGSRINAPIAGRRVDSAPSNVIQNPITSQFNAPIDEHKVDNIKPNVIQNPINGRIGTPASNLETDRPETNLIRNSISNRINNGTTDNRTDHILQNNLASDYPKALDSTGIVGYMNNSSVDPNQGPAVTGLAMSNTGNSSSGDRYNATQSASNVNRASSPALNVTGNPSVDENQSKQYNRTGIESKWNSTAWPESQDISQQNSTPNLADNYAGLSYTAQSAAKEFMLYRYDSSVPSFPVSNGMNTNESSAAAQDQTQSYNNYNLTTNNTSSDNKDIPYYLGPDAANFNANALSNDTKSYSQGAVTYGSNYSTSYRNESSYKQPINKNPVIQTYNAISALPYYYLPTMENKSHNQTSNFSLNVSSGADGNTENAVNQSIAENAVKSETYNVTTRQPSNYSPPITNINYLGVGSNDVVNAVNASNDPKDISTSYYNDRGYKTVVNDASGLPAATTSIPVYNFTIQGPYFAPNAANDSYQGAISNGNAQSTVTERTGVANLYYNSSGYQPIVNEASELPYHNQSSQSPVFMPTNLNDSYRGDANNGTSYAQVVAANKDNVTSQVMADNTVEMPSYNLPSYLPYYKAQSQVSGGNNRENKNTLGYTQDFYRENPDPSIQSLGMETTGSPTYNATWQPLNFSQPTTVDNGYNGEGYNATSNVQPMTLNGSYSEKGYNTTTIINSTDNEQNNTPSAAYYGYNYQTMINTSTEIRGHNATANIPGSHQPSIVNDSGVQPNNKDTSRLQGANKDIYNGYTVNRTSMLPLYNNVSVNSSVKSEAVRKQQNPSIYNENNGYKATENATQRLPDYNYSSASFPSNFTFNDPKETTIEGNSTQKIVDNMQYQLPLEQSKTLTNYSYNAEVIYNSYPNLSSNLNSTNNKTTAPATGNYGSSPTNYFEPFLMNGTGYFAPTLANYSEPGTSNAAFNGATDGQSRVAFRNVAGNMNNTALPYHNDGVTDLYLSQTAKFPENSSLQLSSNMVTKASERGKINQIENTNSSLPNNTISYSANASNEMVNASLIYGTAASNLSSNSVTIGNIAKQIDRNNIAEMETMGSTKYAAFVPSSTNSSSTNSSSTSSPIKTVGTTRNNVYKPDNGQRSVKMVLLKLRQVVASPKAKGSVTETSLKLEKGLNSKDLQREGLFVKPGLNRGVIETIVTKDTVNASKPKSAHAITREVIISNSTKASSSQPQRSNLLQASKFTSERLGQSPSLFDGLAHDDSETNQARAQLIKLWQKTNEYPMNSATKSFARQNLDQSQNSPAVDPDSSVFTGEALKLKVPERDPQRTPNPDELHKGLWTGEAINYTAKAQRDFAEQQKYAQEHGGLKAIDDRIDEHKKHKERTEDGKAFHNPKNAEDTREKMKYFYDRNDEITSQYNYPYYSTSDREKQKNVAGNMVSHNNDEGNKDIHKPGKDEWLKPKKIAGSSSRIGLGSSASSSSSSESSSSSSSETHSEAGVNAESGTNTESNIDSGTTAEPTSETEPSEGDVPSFDPDTAVDESDQVWNPDEDDVVDLDEEQTQYGDYQTPQGLGVYADTNIDVGINSGANAESQVGSDAQSESEMGFNAGSQSPFPSYGFGNGFGMGLGMNTGSQSGSESMTETSVSVGASTDSKTESESKTGSNSNTNPGSKSKYKYKWRKGPGTSEKLMPNSMAVLGLHPVATIAEGLEEEPFNSETGLFKGLPDILESRLGTLTHRDRAKMVSKDYSKDKASPKLEMESIGNHGKPRLNLKDYSKLKAAPQLGIQVGSDAHTHASTSASTQSHSGSNAGSRPLKPKLRLQSHINLEKHRERLGNRMKNHKDRLDYDTQTNPLRLMKMRGKSPTLLKLDAVAEKTRNKPRGSHGPKTNKHHGSSQGNHNTNTGTDPSKVEASVNIQYQGTNANGVDISANINTVNGQQVKKPNQNKNNNDNDNSIGRYSTGSPYGWYVKDSGHVPSTAELNMKLNSMPYAKYVPQMRKASRRTRI